MNHAPYAPPRVGPIPPGREQSVQRLNELLEQVRAEFDAQQQRSGDFDREIHGHLQDVEMIRQQMYKLEQQQQTMKAEYEDKIARLQRELETRDASQAGQHHAPQPPRPVIGHGSNSLFNGIIAGNAGQGGPGLAPPPQEAQQAQGLPPHMGGPSGPPGLNPPGPPQHFAGYPQGPAVNGSLPLRIPSAPSHSAVGYGQPPHPTASPGGKRPGPGPGPGPAGPPPRGPPGPATPQQNTAAPYAASPQVPQPPPPSHFQNSLMSHGQIASMIPHNTLADIELDSLAPEHKKEASDWFAIFNPRIPRRLDVDLIHNIPHQSVVCCVRFSQDGRYVATGCNRSAQIYEVETGVQVAHLQDHTLPEDGDLYIRSVCFSPDGLFLATGAEDKVIRVWDIHRRAIKTSFTGHEQDIYSLDFARNGRIIASGSGDRSVRLWDLDENRMIRSLQIEDGVTTVAISPDNRFVAAGSLDKSVRVWDISTGALMVLLEGTDPDLEGDGHTDSVYSVAFAPSGDRLVSGSLDKTIKMWELVTPPRLPPGAQPSGRCIRTFKGHKDFVLSVALTPNGEWVLSGSKDRGVQFWDPNTGVVQLMLQGHKNSVISVAPSPTGGIFATGSGDMRAKIWRFNTYHG